MDIEHRLKTLSDSVSMHDEGLAEATGSHLVLLAAVLSLVRTHPDQKRFVEEFRRVWLLLGSPNQAAESGSPYAVRIDESLDMLEEVLAVPLGVRPPRD